MRRILIALAVLLLSGLGISLVLKALKGARSAAPLSLVAATSRDEGPVAQPAPASLIVTQIAFDLLGPEKTFRRSSGWSLGTQAHAEWFIAGASGQLSTIQLAAEPLYVRKGRERTAGPLDIFLSSDSNGYPGVMLEEFHLEAIKPSAPAMTNAYVLESFAHPALQAGVKYWLWAKCPGPGSWTWRFNEQNRTALSARENESGVWFSAGNGWNGAFTVFVTGEKLKN